MVISIDSIANLSYLLLMGSIVWLYYLVANSKSYAKDYVHNVASGGPAITMGLLTLVWVANLYDPATLNGDGLYSGIFFGVPAGLFVAIFLNPANIYRVPEGRSAINYLKWSPYGASPYWVDIEGKKSGLKMKVNGPGIHATLRLFYNPNLGPLFTTSSTSNTYLRANVGPAKRTGLYGLYQKIFDSYQNLAAFLRFGQIGLQGEPLELGKTFLIHWGAFTVITRERLIGWLPEPELRAKMERGEVVTPSEIGVEDWRFNLTHISGGDPSDLTKPPEMGLVTCLAGPVNKYGNQVCRLGGFQPFKDLADKRIKEARDAGLIKEDETATEKVVGRLIKGGVSERQRRDIFRYGRKFELKLGSELMGLFLKPQLDKHNSYQDTEAFFREGGADGRQHDPIGPGTYRLSLFLFSVRVVPQPYAGSGEAFTIVGGDGLPAEDITWPWFTYGEIVRPGWEGQFFAFLGRGWHIINTDCYPITRWQARLLTFFFNPNKESTHQMDANPDIFGLVPTISLDGLQPNVNIDVILKFVEENLAILAAAFKTQPEFAEQFLAPRLGALSVEVMTSVKTLELVRKREEVSDQIFDRIASQLDEVYVDTDKVLIQKVENIDEFLDILGAQTKAEQSQETVKAETALAVLEQDKQRQLSLAKDQTELAMAQIRKQIADQDKETLKVQADSIKEFKATAGDKAAEQLATGLVQANVWAATVRTLGADKLSMMEIFRIASEKGVKVLPEYFSGDALSLLGAIGAGKLGGDGKEKPPVPAKTELAPETK